MYDMMFLLSADTRMGAFPLKKEKKNPPTVPEHG